MPHPPKQRILALHLHQLKTDRIARQQWGKSWRLQQSGKAQASHAALHDQIGASVPYGAPIAVTAQIKNAVRLVAINDIARMAGLFVGQTLSDARALAPQLQCFDEDIAAQRALMDEIADWCDRYTPLVAIESEDGLFLDITGCAHLFGGETMLVDDLVRRLHLQGFAAHGAIADTPGAAWAFSRFGSQRVVSSGNPGLAGLPLAALRLDMETVEALAKAGLKTIGCISCLPRAPLATRFGRLVLQRLNQAEGAEEEAISPRKHIAELSSERKFADAIALQEDIERTIHNLAINLQPRLEERGLGLRRIELQLFRVDGALTSLVVQASTPLRDPARIVTLFRERIAGLHDELDAGFGFDLVRLNAVETEAFISLQSDLVERRGANDNLDALVDKLGARIGADRVTSFQIADTHIPERSFGLVPLIHQGRQKSWQQGSQQRAVPASDTLPFTRLCAGANALAMEPGERPDGPLTRPLFLLERPERIDVIAEVPEGPPIRFRWRKALYRVDKCEGPERIACEWWSDGRNAASRDYYRIEEAGGNRFWMFRHGLYGRETTSPAWYMHGIFP